MIAALYVETNGAYYGIEGVDPWDEVRDAGHTLVRILSSRIRPASAGVRCGLARLTSLRKPVFVKSRATTAGALRPR